MSIVAAAVAMDRSPHSMFRYREIGARHVCCSVPGTCLWSHYVHPLGAMIYPRILNRSRSIVAAEATGSVSVIAASIVP